MKKTYEIVGGNTLSILEDEVNKKITLGYFPVGGVFVSPNKLDCVFQAMIKKDKQKKP